MSFNSRNAQNDQLIEAKVRGLKKRLSQMCVKPAEIGYKKLVKCK